MKISLSKIKPSPRPVRSSWDEQALDDLIESIKEQGLIVPIKVRPANQAASRYVHQLVEYGESDMSARELEAEAKFEIVYGHRRVEALRRAGIEEADAVVEGVDDADALIQALIENVQREDLQPMDTARALKALKDETGWSNREIGRRGVMASKYVDDLLALLREPQEIQKKIRRGTPGGRLAGSISEVHVRQARQAGLDDKDRVQVLEKAAKEGLTSAQTRQVADAMKLAESVEVKRRILKTKVTVTEEEIALRAKREVLLERFSHVQDRIPTMDEVLFRRVKPLGKAVDEMNLLAADETFWDALRDQHQRAVVGYLALALDKLQRVYDDLEGRVTGGTETQSEQFRLQSPERDSG